MTQAPTIIPDPDQVTQVAPSPAVTATEQERTASPSLYALIAQQPFFEGLNAHQLQLLTASAMVMSFKKGQAIFQEGSPANRFYLILEGKVVLESEVKERGTILIRTLGPGDDLGWSWLFPPYYLQFSARAEMVTETIFFYGTRLREQCEQDHELGYQLMRRVAQVLIQNLQATQQRLLKCPDEGNLAPQL